MKRRIFNVILVVIILLSLMPLFKTGAQPHNAVRSESGIVLYKDAKYNAENHQVDYKLEAYQTGKVVETEYVRPLDVALVLDLSGSMTREFGEGFKRLPDLKRYGDIPQKENLYVLKNGSFTLVSQISKEDGKVCIQTQDTERNCYDENEAMNDFVYEYTGSNYRRIDALRASVDLFIHNLEETGAGHRVSLIGFAMDHQEKDGYQAYQGTEILMTEEKDVPVRYHQVRDADLEKALIPIENKEKIFRGSQNIQTYKGTTLFLGMDLGRRVLEKNKVKDRKQLMVVFTDGSPNNNPLRSVEEAKGEYVYEPPSGYDPILGGRIFGWNYDPLNKRTFARSGNESIRQAQLIKDNGAEIYTIAVYDGADPNAKDILGYIKDKDYKKPINKLLHFMSSNFHEERPIYLDTEKNSIRNRKLPDPNKYYFAAEDSRELNAAFETISKDVIVAPEITLDEKTKIVDTLTFPFEFDETEVKVTQHSYEGMENGFDLWSEGVDISDKVTVEKIESLGALSISGFDFNDNLVIKQEGKYDGSKIRIEFSAKIRDGFIGGDEIETNGSNSGIYHPEKEKLIQAFPIPKVDIPLRFDFKAYDRSAYVLNDFDLTDFLQEESAFNYQINGENYVLDGVNNAYVDIEIFIDDKKIMTIPRGESIDYLMSKRKKVMQSDQEFSLKFKLKSDKGQQIIEKKADLYGLKPDFDVKDSVSYLGESMSFNENIQSSDKLHWSHQKEGIPKVADKYHKPQLEYQISDGEEDYAHNEREHYFEENKNFSVKVQHLDTTEDVTKILSSTERITFEHRIIPLSFGLKKKVEGRQYSENDHFIFEIEWQKPDHLSHFGDYAAQVVLKDGEISFISGLPIGEYKIFEDETWSWRYESLDGPVKKMELKAGQDDLVIEFINKLKRKTYLTDEKKIRNRFEKQED